MDGGHANPLHYSCLENPKESWWATVHGVTKSRTGLKGLSTHTSRYLSILTTSHPSLYVEILTFKVMVLGDGASGRWSGLGDEVLMLGWVPLYETPEVCQWQFGVWQGPLSSASLGTKPRAAAAVDLCHALKGVQGGQQGWGTLCSWETGGTGLQIVIFRSWFHDPSPCISSHQREALNPFKVTSAPRQETFWKILTFPPLPLWSSFSELSPRMQSSFCPNKT